jgi:hypothetical protein
MTFSNPSQELYSLWLSAYQATQLREPNTPEKELTRLYLEGSTPTANQIVDALSEHNSTPPLDPSQLLDSLHSILLAVLLNEKGDPSDQKLVHAQILTALNPLQSAVDHSFQLFTTLTALIKQLCGVDFPSPFIKLTQSGMAPQHELYAPGERGVPLSPFHALQGVYCLLLGKVSGDNQLISAAQGVTQWHEKVLDHDRLPPIALYAKQESGPANLHLAATALLFTLSGHFFSQPEWKQNATAQLEALNRTEASSCGGIPPLFPLIVQWSKSWPITDNPAPLTSEAPFNDGECALITHRTEKCSAVATLVGEGTGMGSFKVGDVSILTYGPHVMELHEGQGYGVEQEVLTPEILLYGDNTLPHTSFDRDIPSLSGTVRAGTIPQATVEHTLGEAMDHLAVPNFWVRSKQTLFDNETKITARPLFVGDWVDPNFVFYVNSDCCELEGGRELLPDSLDGYRGQVESVFLKGKEGGILLTSTEGCEEMQVIPLAGGPNYWGANFMVAYSLGAPGKDYSWSISNK